MFFWIGVLIVLVFMITSIVSNIINIIVFFENKNNIDTYEEYKKKLNG